MLERIFLLCPCYSWFTVPVIFSLRHIVCHLREPSVRFARSHDESERIGHLAREDDSVYTCNSRKADDLLCVNFEFLLNLQMTLHLSDIQNPMHAGIELLVNHLSLKLMFT